MNKSSNLKIIVSSIHKFHSDSVELQKITLQQITLIDSYEKDAKQAADWLEDILRVMLKDHAHVGCSVEEIHSQKEEHQVFLETAKVRFHS